LSRIIQQGIRLSYESDDGIYFMWVKEIIDKG